MRRFTRRCCRWHLQQQRAGIFNVRPQAAIPVGVNAGKLIANFSAINPVPSDPCRAQAHPAQVTAGCPGAAETFHSHHGRCTRERRCVGRTISHSSVPGRRLRRGAAVWRPAGPRLRAGPSAEILSGTRRCSYRCCVDVSAGEGRCRHGGEHYLASVLEATAAPAMCGPPGVWEALPILEPVASMSWFCSLSRLGHRSAIHFVKDRRIRCGDSGDGYAYF